MGDTQGLDLKQFLELGAHIGDILAGAGVFAVFAALLLQRTSVRHQSLLHMHQYLSQSGLGTARLKVRTELFGKPYVGWSTADRELANSVCASYDQAGLLFDGGTVDKATADVFLKSSWGTSICDQYEALVPFLSDYQTPNQFGYQFFEHFTNLYEKARLFHRRPCDCQHLKIVTGGQTGVDRAALDVAIAMGLNFGGWCPKGGWAEDMPHAPGLLYHYGVRDEEDGRGLKSATSAEPAERTELNVRDSDATLIIVGSAGHERSPGTSKTLEAIQKYQRPHLIVHANTEEAARQVIQWVSQLRTLNALNVAGPRGSESPEVYLATRALLRMVLPELVAHCADCSERLALVRVS